MSGEADTPAKSPTVGQLLNEWKAMIGFVVLILGGYFWLEANYARIEKLESEKCSLSYDIRIMRADIEFNSVDEDIDTQRSELEALLQAPLAPEDRIEFKKGFIASLDARASEIGERKNCLQRARDGCFQGNYDTNQCYPGQ